MLTSSRVTVRIVTDNFVASLTESYRNSKRGRVSALSMAGPTNPDLSTPYVRVTDRGNDTDPVDGVRVEGTSTALMITDCGSMGFAKTTCPALSVTSSAANLASLNTNKMDVIARRGIQLRADSNNTKDVVIGPIGVVASATPSSIVGMPLTAGSSIFIEVTQLSQIYAVAESGTQILHWLAY